MRVTCAPLPPTGGTGGTGTMTGDAGVMNSAMCPATEPMDGSMCMSMGFVQCTYGANQCQCFGGNWNCGAGGGFMNQDGGMGGFMNGNDPSCPNMTPPAGGACTNEGTTCSYRGPDCTCTNSAWECEMGGFMRQDGGGFMNQDGGMGNGGNCPAQEPEDNSDCTNDQAGMTCDYGGTSCGCFGGGWRC